LGSKGTDFNDVLKVRAHAAGGLETAEYLFCGTHERVLAFKLRGIGSYLNFCFDGRALLEELRDDVCVRQLPAQVAFQLKTHRANV
jgi:hypothetical protein